MWGVQQLCAQQHCDRLLIRCWDLRVPTRLLASQKFVLVGTCCWDLILRGTYLKSGDQGDSSDIYIVKCPKMVKLSSLSPNKDTSYFFHFFFFTQPFQIYLYFIGPNKAIFKFQSPNKGLIKFWSLNKGLFKFQGPNKVNMNGKFYSSPNKVPYQSRSQIFTKISRKNIWTIN